MHHRSLSRSRALALAACALLLFLTAMVPGWDAAAQSGRQPGKKAPEKKTDTQPAPGKGTNPGKPEDQENAPIPKGLQDEPPLKLSTQVVNCEVTVIDKKTKRLVPNLTKKNFIIYEDGIKQEVTNFAPGEGPITVVVLLDNGFHNRYYRDYFTPSRTEEIFLSASAFLQGIKNEDFAAVVAFSMKPKVIQDFTSDRQKLNAALISAYRDLLNFSESNIYDALSFVLLGGKAIQLYEEGAGPNDYTGLQEIEGHTAVILITTGIDTFSRITYDKALKIVANAGVPIFTISVGNLFFKKYEDRLPPEERLTVLQAQNSLKSFAEKSGGSYFEMTFEGEIPGIMKTIEVLLRTQYSIGYTPTNTRRAGKERKIKVDIDIDGDGNPETSQLELRYRRGYFEANDSVPDKGKK